MRGFEAVPVHSLPGDSMRHFFAATAACLALVSMTPAIAADPYNDARPDRDRHERGDPSIQVGDRPRFLIDGMDDSELKRKLQSCPDELVRRTQVLHRTSRRAAAVPGAHEGGVRRPARARAQASSSATSRSRRMASSFAVTTNATCTPPPTSRIRRSMPAARCHGRARIRDRVAARATSRWRSSDAEGQDGCVGSRRHHGRGLSRWHGHLAHGSLQQPRHAAHAEREHRAEQASRRGTHARTQGRQPGTRECGVRQPGRVRAGDDRRVQARRRESA